MAIFKNSTFGIMRKSIGDDVAYRSGGQNIVRKKPAHVNDAKTVDQIKQRNAFTYMVELFRILSLIIKTSFIERNPKHSAYNVFMSQNLKTATNKDDAQNPVFWDKLILSRGSMIKPKVRNIADNGDGSISVVTNNLVDNNLLFDTDKLRLVAIPKSNPSAYVVSDVAIGQNENFTLDTPDLDGIGTVSVYAYHLSADNTKTSDSVYLGALNM